MIDLLITSQKKNNNNNTIILLFNISIGFHIKSILKHITMVAVLISYDYYLLVGTDYQDVMCALIYAA